MWALSRLGPDEQPNDHDQRAVNLLLVDRGTIGLYALVPFGGTTYVKFDGFHFRNHRCHPPFFDPSRLSPATTLTLSLSNPNFCFRF